MRRITFAAMSTLTALVLLFSYHTSTSSQIAASTSIAPRTGTSSSGGSSSGGSSSGGSSSGTSGGSSSAGSGTFTGDSVDTRWGPVQVQITVAGGKITASDAVVFPSGNPRDQEINSYAVPTLNAEVVQSQSGNIDAVSGATVTSDGYIQSLQSAIDQANL